MVAPLVAPTIAAASAATGAAAAAGMAGGLTAGAGGLFGSASGVFGLLQSAASFGIGAARPTPNTSTAISGGTLSTGPFLPQFGDPPPTPAQQVSSQVLPIGALILAGVAIWVLARN